MFPIVATTRLKQETPMTRLWTALIAIFSVSWEADNMNAKSYGMPL